MTIQTKSKFNLGHVLIGFGIALEIGAIILIILNIRQGSPPIAVGLAPLIVGTTLISIGSINQAKKKP